jgi:hypothetical protein
MPMHYATSTAIHELAAWVDDTPAPRSGPRFEFEGGVLAKDAHGNTRGGIRLPPIDVPVARYESTLCQLGGITVPFLEPQLHALYPTHATYLALMAERTDAAVEAGWLLPEDASDLMRRACEAGIRWLPPQAPCAPYDPPAFRSAAAPPAAPPGEATAPPANPTASSEPGGGRLPATGSDGLAPAAALLLAAALLTRSPLRRAGR